MIRALAAAKVNLALDVLSRRADGYHQVDMIMQSVSLYDELTFEHADHTSLIVEGDAPASDENLVLRAATLLKEYTGCSKEAQIRLIKRIPTAAGLGGGSADAAATLVALSKLWGLFITNHDLLSLGARLGADIPFCMSGGIMRATGIGTDLTPLPSAPPFALVVVRPCDGISTRQVYQGLRLDAPLPRPDIPAMIDAISRNSIADLCAGMGNALESVTLPARPQVADMMERMLALGALQARMSGSGPSVFGVFLDADAAERALGALGVGFLCTPVDQGVLIYT